MGITHHELDKLLSAVEKKMTKGSRIHRGNAIEYARRIPFKSPNMNYATEGGAAIGRFNAFWGGESSFKTRLLYELIAQAQNLNEASELALYPRIKLYRDIGENVRARILEEELEYIQARWPDGMECAYYNAEMQYDGRYAEKLGIDTDRLIVVESTTIEDIVGVMQSTYDTIDMHAVDSTSSCSSVEEQGMKLTDRRMGLDARVWKTALKKTMRHFDNERNVGILIHQVSTNIRTGGLQAVSTRFLRHTSSMTIKFQRGRYLFVQDGVLKPDKPDGADEHSLAGRVEPDGVEIFAEVEKSRVCRPFRIAALHARFGAKTLDHVWELVNAAIHLGIATRTSEKSSWYIVKGDEDDKHNGEKQLYHRVAGDDELQAEIYARLMRLIDDPEEDELKPEEMAAAAA